MVRDSHIILDTCIANNWLSKEFGLSSKTNDVANALLANGNILYVSHFTKYELLRCATKEKKAKSEQLLSMLKQVETNNDRLNRAIRLYSLYKENSEVKNHLQSISDMDVFIGSLIFTNKNIYLLTADYCDFPRPFFLEEKIWHVEYARSKGGRSSIYYYLLKANMEEF